MKRRQKRFLKAMICIKLRKQIITSSKLRRGPSNDNVDFIPIARKADSFIPIGIGDKAFDDESNHAFLREELNALSIIPARNENIPIWRTKGKYRKEMKRGYSKKMYHQRSKVETVFYVIKKSMGDDIKSIKTKAQNNEMRFKIIAYNAARIASLAYSLFVGFLQSQMFLTFKYEIKQMFVQISTRSVKLLILIIVITSSLVVVNPAMASQSSLCHRHIAHLDCLFTGSSLPFPFQPEALFQPLDIRTA